MEHYLTIKQNEFLSSFPLLMGLEMIMFITINQAQKGKDHLISSICETKALDHRTIESRMLVIRCSREYETGLMEISSFWGNTSRVCLDSCFKSCI